jgi:O-antigen ligase
VQYIIGYMKSLFRHIDNTEHAISYWHLALFLALLPFDFFYSQLVVISFAAHTLIHLRKERLRLLLRQDVWVATAVFWVGLAGMLYSQDRATAWDLAGRQSVIVIWPILLTLTNLPLARYVHRLLHFFALACVCTILYLYADALYIIYYNHQPLRTLFTPDLMNHQFCLPIGIHATYLSLYAALSVVVLLRGYFTTSGWRNRLWYAIGTAILLAGLLQLSSRAVCIALLVIMNTVFPWLVLKGTQRVRFWVVSLLLTLAAGFFIARTTAFRTRYFTELKQDLVQSGTVDYDVAEPRIERWKLAWQLVGQAPLLGHGSGSELRLLKEQYFQHRLYSSYINEFNAHSQYLSFLLKTGIAGLLVYLYVLGYGCWVAWRRKDIFAATFLLLVIIVSVGENVLDVNKGIFFYAFFFVLALKDEAIDKGSPP